jgi:hypothetical protein
MEKRARETELGVENKNLLPRNPEGGWLLCVAQDFKAHIKELRPYKHLLNCCLMAMPLSLIRANSWTDAVTSVIRIFTDVGGIV